MTKGYLAPFAVILANRSGSVRNSFKSCYRCETSDLDRWENEGGAFGSEQQLLAYVRWATLQDLGDRRGKFEQGIALASSDILGAFSRAAHSRGGK